MTGLQGVFEKLAKDLGVKGFLKKPIARGDLSEMVSKVLDEAKGSTSDYVILFATISGLEWSVQQLKDHDSVKVSAIQCLQPVIQIFKRTII